jgi:hypothetical protein
MKMMMLSDVDDEDDALEIVRVAMKGGGVRKVLSPIKEGKWLVDFDALKVVRVEENSRGRGYVFKIPQGVTSGIDLVVCGLELSSGEMEQLA